MSIADGERIRIAVGAFGIDVDQAHLDRRERVLQIALTGVTLVVEPFQLGTPVHVLLGLPLVLAAEREAERLEAHVVERHVAGEDDQVGPGQVLAVLLLDRPQQPAGLVQAGVVRPAVQRGEPLHTGAATTTAVA